MENEPASHCVIALASALIDTVAHASPQWHRAYVRLEADAGGMSSRASYVDAQGVHLLGAIDHSVFHSKAIDLGLGLRQFTRTGRRHFLVCLVIVDAARNYEVLFEYKDAGKWAISKLDGGSGIPVGLPEVKLAVTLPETAVQPRPWYKFWS